MKKKIGTSLAILLAFIFLSLELSALPVAQLDDISFEHISVGQGLSQSTVFCILQDRQGFMWFGTQHGLNRYDGHNFKVYDFNPKDPHSLGHNLVLSLYEDREGILWVGTWGGGLNRFDPKTEKFYRYKYKPDDPSYLSNGTVNTIFEDKSGILWIGTNNGVIKFDRESKIFTPYLDKSVTPDSQDGRRVSAIYLDESDILLIGTDDGLYKYDREKDKFILFTCEGTKDSSLPKMRTIYGDNGGALWIGSSDGLYKFKRQNERLFHSRTPSSNLNILYGKQISTFFRDSSGILWIGTQGDGLFLLDPQGEKTLHHTQTANDPGSINNNDIRAIYEDKTGVIWIGTNGGGLNKFDPRRKKFRLYRNIPGNANSLNNNDVLVIRMSRSGAVWIGTRGGGLNKFESRKNKFTHYRIPDVVTKSKRKNEIRAICEDNSGKLWVGTQGAGLYIFDPEKERFEPYIDSSIGREAYILSIFKDQDGELWIGSMEGGLTRMQQDGGESENFEDKLSHEQVFAIFEDKAGILWIGTGNGGLNKFDRENGTFVHYKPSKQDPNSISHNFITAIYEDKAGRFWIGTNGGGLNKFDREKKLFTIYTTENGLPNNVIYDILEDKTGNLWLSTNKGLSRFNPKTNSFRNYTVRDGLQDYEFNRRAACKCEGNKIYIGGVNGFNIFDPEELGGDLPAPPVVFTAFKKLDEDFELGAPIYQIKELEMSYRDSISIEFAALCFSDPEKNQYAYKLEPVNQEWIHLGNKHDIILTNLEPDDYTLRIKGSNDEGIWNEEGASIRIKVNPPFWATKWFQGLFFMTILSSVIGFAVWRIKNVEKKKEDAERQKEQLSNAYTLLKEQVDERERAEAKQRESEQLYRTLFDTSPDAIMLCDIKGKIIMPNQQTSILLGYSADEMVKKEKYIFRLLTREDREKARKNARQALRTRITRNIEFDLIAKDGTKIPADISTSLIKDDEGNPKFFLEIIRDIREHKKAEKREKQQREKMIQMDKMASLGTLVSGVAHEINNPVNVIKLNTEIFSRAWESSMPVLDEHYNKSRDFEMAGLPYLESKSRLEGLIIGSMESAKRIKEIVDELKNFSRPEESFTREIVDINKVIQSSVSLTNNMIKKATNNFSIVLPDNLPSIEGNSQKLERVFINLIQNAVQALPSNDKARGIYISTEYKKTQKKIEVKVRDEGKGIEDKDLKFIMDPFYTTKRDEGGTGLGLYISMQIIGDHGGKMDFKSTPGKGTTVIVLLPVK